MRPLGGSRAGYGDEEECQELSIELELDAELVSRHFGLNNFVETPQNGKIRNTATDMIFCIDAMVLTLGLLTLCASDFLNTSSHPKTSTAGSLRASRQAPILTLPPAPWLSPHARRSGTTSSRVSSERTGEWVYSFASIRQSHQTSVSVFGIAPAPHLARDDRSPSSRILVILVRDLRRSILSLTRSSLRVFCHRSEI